MYRSLNLFDLYAVKLVWLQKFGKFDFIVKYNTLWFLLLRNSESFVRYSRNMEKLSGKFEKGVNSSF